VRNEAGHPVEGLNAQEFVLLDDGHARPVSVDTIGTGIAPIALAIVVQSSGISAPVLAKFKEVVGMVQPVVTGEHGCALLISFAEKIETLQDCINNDTALRKALQNLRTGAYKDARMLDAVKEATKQLSRHKNARRVVLLISESKDRGSESDIQSVIMDALIQGVAVYTVNYSATLTGFTTKSTMQLAQSNRLPNGPPAGVIPGREPVPRPIQERVNILAGLHEVVRLGAANTSRALVEGTGGQKFSFKTKGGLEEILQQFGEQLHTQYLLSFTPRDAAPGYHKLEVRVNRPGVTVRARPGYWSTSK
jgi:VWFA-related protein